MKFKRGDTLIEVMFSVGIFGLVAVGAIGVMNRGLYTAQATLETTMARNEIDTQAEALRFVHDAYVSKKSSNANLYKVLWEEIKGKAYSGQDINRYLQIYDMVAQGGGELDGVNYSSCEDLYNAIPGNSFIINPSVLDTTSLETTITDGEFNNRNNTLITKSEADRNSKGEFTTSATYPRLIYTRLTDVLSDADATGINSRTLSAAEGIWVTAVASETGKEVECDADGNPGTTVEPDYYDFYIRTCWDSPGSSNPKTISTNIRLYNSDQISLTENHEITFENIEWVRYGDKAYRGCSMSYCTGGMPKIGSDRWGYTVSCEPAAGQHVTFPDANSILLLGSTADPVKLGAYYDKFSTSAKFDLSVHVDASNIGSHPSENGGFSIQLDIVDENGNTLKTGAVAQINPGTQYLKVGSGDNVSITTKNFDLVLSHQRGAFSVCATPQGGSEQCATGIVDIPANSYLKVSYNLTHGSHCCNNNAVIRLNDIHMSQVGGSSSSTVSSSRCGKGTYTIWYNKNDGTGATRTVTATVDSPVTISQNTFSNDGSGTMADQSSDIDKPLQLRSNAFTRPGYRFVGWRDSNTPDTGTYKANVWANGATIPANTYVSTQEVTLYAQWERVEYSITYHGNGDSDDQGNILNSTKSITANAGDQHTVLGADTFSRIGYTIDNWNTSQNGSGTAYKPGSGITVNGNIDLYAQWIVDDFSSSTSQQQAYEDEKLINFLLLVPRNVSNLSPSINISASDPGLSIISVTSAINSYACENPNPSQNPACPPNYWNGFTFHVVKDTVGGTGVVALRLYEKVTNQNKSSFVFYHSNTFTVAEASQATYNDSVDRGNGIPQLTFVPGTNAFRITNHQKTNKISGSDAQLDNNWPKYWVIAKVKWSFDGFTVEPINRFTDTSPNSFL